MFKGKFSNGTTPKLNKRLLKIDRKKIPSFNDDDEGMDAGSIQTQIAPLKRKGSIPMDEIENIPPPENIPVMPSPNLKHIPSGIEEEQAGVRTPSPRKEIEGENHNREFFMVNSTLSLKNRRNMDGNDQSSSSEDQCGSQGTESRFERYYDVLNVIGNGHYGTVYRCKNVFDGNVYAIKCLKNKFKGKNPHTWKTNEP